MRYFRPAGETSRRQEELVMGQDQGGTMWLIIDVIFVAVLAIGLIYGISMARRRRRNAATEHVRRGDIRPIFDHADAIEHERHRAGLCQRAAALGEAGAHFARGPVAIVGQDLDDDGGATRPVTLVTHFLVRLRIAALRLLDR